MSSGRPLFAKLFLEGIEVPFIGASITSTINQATICYIDMVPQSIINNIKPRTLVHLMVRDINDTTGKYPFVLAFQGEVFGYNLGKTTTSRSFSISCIDHSSYWDNVLTYFFNLQQDLGQGAEQMLRLSNDEISATKGGAGKVITIAHATTSYYRTIVNKAYSAAAKKGQTADLFDGLAAICKDIGGINDFYLMAEDRLRIVDRIGAVSSGAVTKLLSEQEGLDYTMGVVGRQSGFMTLRDVISNLMSMIFHDYVSLPFPSVVINSEVSKSLTFSKTPTTIGEFIFKPNMYMISPPMCNIFFPDEYSSFNFSRNFFQEPTRLIYKPEIPNMPGSGVQGVTLFQVYEPECFSHYMKGPKGAKTPTADIGDGDTQIAQDQGQFGDADLVNGKPREVTNGRKREHTFLTNEEKYKGIIMAQESMVPAASQFRQSVGQLGRTTFSNLAAKYLFNKKRFENRQIQITSHLKMSVVPGFTAMVLDDSDANQNIVAYCNSVTHRIYCNQGGYTNTTLSYARTVEEQQATNGKSGEPLIPEWMRADIFGSKAAPTATKNKKISTDVAKAGTQTIVPDALSTYFARLLGPKGSNSINKYKGEPTLIGAVQALLQEYRENKKKGGEAVSGMIDAITSRRYVTMDEAFSYFGAIPIGGSSEGDFLEYYGNRLSGDNNTLDSLQLKARKKIIKDYRDALRANRGFRG